MKKILSALFIFFFFSAMIGLMGVGCNEAMRRETTLKVVIENMLAGMGTVLFCALLVIGMALVGKALDHLTPK